MSRTALLFLCLFAGGLIGGIFHPVYPLVAYLVDYYQHPPLRWWGRGLPSGIRWSLLASVVTLLATFLHGRFPVSAAALRHRSIHGLIVFGLIAAAVTPLAVDVPRSLHYLEQLWLLIVLSLVIIAAVDSQRNWRLIVLVMAIGSFTWGLDAWLDPERVAGRLQAVGGPDSFNDNSAAVHLLAILPFLAVMGFYGTLVERVAALLSFPFVVNAIILCNSRGATVAMVGMAATALVLVKGRQRVRLLFLSAAAAVAFLALADPQFLERQATIVSDERDGSSQGRLDSWAGAIELMKDYPLGAGGGGFDVLSPIYIPEVVAAHDGAERAAHNTYLWIGSDWGVLGLAAFVVFLWSPLVALQRARLRATDTRLRMETIAVQASIVGISIGAFFINRAYGEIVYWVPSLGAALINLIDAHSPTTAPLDPEPAAAPDTVSHVA